MLSRNFMYGILGILSLVLYISAFNLSPEANFILHKKFNTSKPQQRSSYFGYKLIMRSTSLFVSAPRAQSTLPLQSNIEEPGAIYRCDVKQPYNCDPYVFESRGNIPKQGDDEYYNEEVRDFQMLGASMDGGTKDTDKLIVCAPRFGGPYRDFQKIMIGICYWINDTSKPDTVLTKKSLNMVNELVYGENYIHAYAESGFSLHISPDNQQVLSGAPGKRLWSGSLIRYYNKKDETLPNNNRRDTKQRKMTRRDTGNNILDPSTWRQPENSYFGYAVCSGYFDSEDKKELLYVATAPQFNHSGQAYLFNIQNNINIIQRQVFNGSQFGEYFGYSILAEDINNDDLTDVVISAPQYSINGVDEDGAIYVFINQGGFNFERTLIPSPEHGNVRFGTTLSSLGDINRDGFKDIAVGAPFAGNGSVFIYLGTPKGLRDRPSQRLDSPTNLKASFSGSHMYGHGLSKGVDIDGNGFNDLAVGAPNAEAVMVYRAYPVVKIEFTVNSKSKNQTEMHEIFEIEVCYKMTTRSTILKETKVEFRIAVDEIRKRTHPYANFTDIVEIQTKCKSLHFEVLFTDIFKSIEYKTEYILINPVPNSKLFCENCAVVDPNDPKNITGQIYFSTGCNNNTCVVDLKVKTIHYDEPFILGSSDIIKMTYEINNTGDNAHLPQIKFTSSNNMHFAKNPTNCKKTDDDTVMFCDLNNTLPIYKDRNTTIDVVYESKGISGKNLTLTAEVFNQGKEKTPHDNKVVNVIKLREFSEIYVIGSVAPSLFTVDETTDIPQVVNNYEIKSVGPSTVSTMEVVFLIPVAYRDADSTTRIPIIDEQNITVEAFYDSKHINFDFYENKMQIIMNAVEYEGTSVGQLHERHRRATTLHSNEPEDINLLGSDLKSSLPINSTIIFNCRNNKTFCVRAVGRIDDFKPEKRLTIIMSYQVQLKSVSQMLVNPWKAFVVSIDANVQIPGGNTIYNWLEQKKELNHLYILKPNIKSSPIRVTP